MVLTTWCPPAPPIHRIPPLKAPILWAANVALLSLLVGCGGGGSNGGPSAPSLQWAVTDPASARSLVGGSPPNASSAQVEAAYNRAGQRANLMLGDAQYLSNYRGRITSTCRGTVCNTSVGQLDGRATAGSIPGVQTDEEYRAVMTHRSVSIGEARAEATFEDYPSASAEQYTLGGWLDYSGFVTVGALVYEGPKSEGWSAAVVAHVSAGQSSGTRPAGGSATWLGSMTAADLEFGHIVMGNSTVTMDFAKLDVDVSLTNIVDLDARARLASVDWVNVPVAANGPLGTRPGRSKGRSTACLIRKLAESSPPARWWVHSAASDDQQGGRVPGATPSLYHGKRNREIPLALPVPIPQAPRPESSCSVS